MEKFMLILLYIQVFGSVKIRNAILGICSSYTGCKTLGVDSSNQFSFTQELNNAVVIIRGCATSGSR